MKKIINRKLYDTDTAKAIGSWTNNYTGFHAESERLYRKKTGEYFLYGSGGPMSKYAVSIENGTSGSSKIIPLSENEAKDWAEEHLTADKYIAVFGNVEE